MNWTKGFNRLDREIHFLTDSDDNILGEVAECWQGDYIVWTLFNGIRKCHGNYSRNAGKQLVETLYRKGN